MEQYSIKMCRGDTFQSDYFQLFTDKIPDFATRSEIEQGIVDGKYTTIDIENLNIRGQVRSDYDGLKIFDLVIVKEADRFYFEIPAASTNGMNGSNQTLVYDIQSKDESDVVTTLVYGTITVMRDVTTENIL